MCIQQYKSGRWVYLPVWVCVELAEMIDWAKQPRCEDVSPAAPGLGGIRILDIDECVRVYRHITIFAAWEILLWNQLDDSQLEALCV